MAAPTISLPVFGTAPNQYTTREQLEKAVNDGLAAVDGHVDEASGNALRSRSLIVGRVTALTRSAGGSPTITLGEPGYYYEENKGGVPTHAIAPLPAPVSLALNEAIIVDFQAGATDEQGRYIPTVGPVASGANTGWQSAKKFVLVARGGTGGATALTGEYDRTDALTAPALASSARARRHVGGWARIERQQGPGSFRVSLSEGYVVTENSGGAPSVIIAPVAATVVDLNSGFVIDLDSPVLDAHGRHVPQYVNVAGGAGTGWQTANKIVLFAVVLRVGGAAPASERKAGFIGSYRTDDAGAFDAEVAWLRTNADQLPIWNPATRVLQWWDMFLMIKGRASRVWLAAGTIEVPAGGFWVVVLDTSVIPTGTDTADIPNTAVKVLTYGIGSGATSWAAEPGRYIPLFVVSFNYTYPVRFPPVRGSTIWPGSSGGSAGYQTDEIVVIANGSTSAKVYLHGGNPAGSKYTELPIENNVNAAIGSDVWRINGIYDAERTGESAFSRGQMICNNGEIEMAIKIAGKTDHIGGTAHGDEIKQWARMLVNGVAKPLNAAAIYRCRTVEFMQESYLYEPDTGTPQSNHIATAYRRWRIEGGWVDFWNRITWNAAFTLDQAFLAMLPILREGSGGHVSNEGYREPLFLTEDLSAGGFPAVYSAADQAKTSGDLGFSAEMQMLKGWDKPGRRFNFSPAAIYNKMYFDFTGPGYVTTPGEVMEGHARFRIGAAN